MRPDWFTLPNAISLGRLAFVPVFVWLHERGRFELALLCFTVAGLSDGVDGLLARLLNQRSRLGAFLDPVADKVLGLAAVVLLTAAGKLPVWLIALILFRDGCMVVGTLVVRAKHLELPSAPTRIGKYATLSLFALIVLTLATESVHAPPWLASYIPAVGWGAGTCLVISTIQYFHRHGHLFFDPARELT